METATQPNRRTLLPFALLASFLLSSCQAVPAEEESKDAFQLENKVAADVVEDALASGGPTPSDAVYCGGETTRAATELYFKDLRSALSEATPNRRFNQFVGERFGIRSEQGKSIWFDLADFDAITPGKITLEEWREISSRGPDQLQNAGWRGCFFDNGKVWFEATEDTGLKLTWISKDMPWVKRESH